jgi:protein-disulfide isomerase
MTRLFRPAALVLTAALALAACNKGEATPGVPSGDALAKVAAPAGTAWSDTVSENADGGFVMGNPNAPIKLVEYGSLSCPHCAKLSQEGTEKLKTEYVDSGRVSWEFRSFAIHPQDVPLTILATCGGKDTFFPLMEQVYTNFDAMSAVYNDKAAVDRANAASTLPPAQRFPALASALGYVDFFAQRGVSADQANKCLADPARAQKVASLAEQYGNAGINGTPTLLINGTTVDGNTWAVLEPLLQKAGAR